jgi:hypothetical protein
MKGKLIAALAAVPVAVLLGAGTAHANDDQDQQFVSLLQSHGLPVHGTAQARQFGLAVCEALESGHDIDWATTDAMWNNHVTRDEAHFAVVSAVSVYCPGADK